MSKEQLSKMIDGLINDKPEQASTALHDYLTAKMQQVAGIKENYGSDDDKDLGEMIDEYMQQESMYHLEGPSGVRNLEKLVLALSSQYTDIREFLSDNSGACEAIVEWIKTQNVSEWQETIEGQLNERPETGEDDYR